MKIVCLIENGFEDSEFQKPYDAFRQAGHEVTLVGTEAGKEIKGSKGQITTRTERAIQDVRPDQFDALLIPGGFSPDRLRAHDAVVAFTREFTRSGRPVFAICHGPQLLITADVLQGKRLTAWKTIQADLGKMGFNVVDEEVVVDGPLVTSRKPDDIPAFVRESLRLLQRVGATRAPA
jgi:protease I